MSSQILILKQHFSFSFSTVAKCFKYIQSFKPHDSYTRMCPTTVVPLHVATAKGSW